MPDKKAISIETVINAPIEKVWRYWTEPVHIVKWCVAQDDWEAPAAENDLRVGGKFKTRMQAKDGSQGFDWEGTYVQVEPEKIIEYSMSDGRNVKIEFISAGDDTRIFESFEMESENSEEKQRAGWQAILNNFKKYVETN
jgi:uncharacterized protein YndB with AHSA1/START domain